MKIILLITVLFFNAFPARAQSSANLSAQPDSSKEIEMVEASCGQCNFGMKGEGCTLAVRIDGKSYYVEGADIDAFGDAHAHDGFCEAIRKAEVQGEIKKGKFQVSYFKLLDDPGK